MHLTTNNYWPTVNSSSISTGISVAVHQPQIVDGIGTGSVNRRFILLGIIHSLPKTPSLICSLDFGSCAKFVRLQFLVSRQKPVAWMSGVSWRWNAGPSPSRCWICYWDNEATELARHRPGKDLLDGSACEDLRPRLGPSNPLDVNKLDG